ncbi:hypothetical protein ThidrDRAFT_4435 [Thiorhodococcus drewsii AZ1]|uniref:Uncharacterized protein n=1 Tax=Thiorhodococcus drewsii AZ1 TaxID=765913 RepID=G2E821_9GAMM|nr:hypothetical protein [Thiorhodococcus drewsii]EGV27764.1 hypothetical protein ThidrDRAFT_4435 [Thiorhodococcus drewsii AZ1]
MGCDPTEYLKQATFAHLSRIEAQSRRRFREPTLAEEAVNFVLEGLQADDWQRVRQYRNRSKLSTFLDTVSARLLEDFSRQRFGRLRMPDWVRAQGALSELLFRLLCMERRPMHEALEIAADSAPGGRDRALLDDIVRAIRARYPKCGEQGPTMVGIEELDSLPSDPETLGKVSAGLPGVDILEREQDAVLRVLGRQLLEADADDSSGTLPATDYLADLKARLHVTSEERLLLKLVFVEGLTVSAAGRLLGYNANETHGRLRRLLQRIRSILQEYGVNFGSEDFG